MPRSRSLELLRRGWALNPMNRLGIHAAIEPCQLARSGRVPNLLCLNRNTKPKDWCAQVYQAHAWAAGAWGDVFADLVQGQLQQLFLTLLQRIVSLSGVHVEASPALISAQQCCLATASCARLISHCDLATVTAALAKISVRRQDCSS